MPNDFFIYQTLGTVMSLAMVILGFLTGVKWYPWRTALVAFAMLGIVMLVTNGVATSLYQGEKLVQMRYFYWGLYLTFFAFGAFVGVVLRWFLDISRSIYRAFAR